MAGPPLQRETILQALQQVLEWPEIARSPQLGKFLDYIVRRTLDEQEQSIKAYSIAVDVFGRQPDFDPQADPIVRVQARRLRSLLDDYYRGPGRDLPLQIRLPVGRYIPEFVTPPSIAARGPQPPVPPAGSEPRRAARVIWPVMAVIALGLALAIYAVMTWGRAGPQADMVDGALHAPRISVVEFQNLTGISQPTPQVAGLAIELVTDLGQFDNIGVSYRVGSSSVPAPETLPPNDFVLTGIVRRDGEQVQYSAILTASRTGDVVWNQTLAVPAEEAADPDVLDKVSKSFSMVLGSPRGPLHAPARQLLAAGLPENMLPNGYLCRVLFAFYREIGGSLEASRASACFESLGEVDQQGAAVFAATASLLAEKGSPAMEDSLPLADRYRIAAENIERAIDLNPINSFIWEQRARLHEAQGAMVQARADYSSSVQLNPANSDALAAFARLLALSGSLSQAEGMARDAAEHSPQPPAWYFGVPALLALRDGDYATAVTYAERYAQADRELGPILAIMAGQRAGDSAVVNRYLPEILDSNAFRAKGVLPQLRERISDNSLVDAIRTALTEAGVPWIALTRPF